MSGVINVNIGDYIRLRDESLFCSMHSQNIEIASIIKNNKIMVSRINDSWDVRGFICNGKSYEYGIYHRELVTCFELCSDDNNNIEVDESGYGSFKIIVTYQDGNTIEEEGVTNITIKPTSVSYKFNRKKYGFIKYSGEVALELTDLKQITISIPSYERVFHIENGVIIREHLMYDTERKFKSFSVGS
jgi:hypothetical protein